MRRQLLLLLVFSVTSITLSGQECNKLGAWLWFIEQTGFATHEQLAHNLSDLGIQRVYVKVADGRVNTDRWPELIDASLINAYKDQGMEVWAWSYNYPLNDSLQAEALYLAAETGYDGFVVDVEVEFNGNPLALHNLFFAFNSAKSRAINDNLVDDDFDLYCTTWGNPRDHNFSISVINPFVTGFMPQTYVELWSFADLDDITFWVEEGTREYRALGATRPIHHITTTQEGLMTPDNIDEFIAASGPETSLWRIPGGDVSLEIWRDWQEVNWAVDFCGTTSTDFLEVSTLKAFPNPTSGLLYLENLPQDGFLSVAVYDVVGRLCYETNLLREGAIDLTELTSGIYHLIATLQDGSRYQGKIVKQ